MWPFQGLINWGYVTASLCCVVSRNIAFASQALSSNLGFQLTFNSQLKWFQSTDLTVIGRGSCAVEAPWRKWPTLTDSAWEQGKRLHEEQREELVEAAETRSWDTVVEPAFAHYESSHRQSLKGCVLMDIPIFYESAVLQFQIWICT